MVVKDQHSKILAYNKTMGYLTSKLSLKSIDIFLILNSATL